ncbi:MAG: response regulator transcription factor [Lachnospiraceae bacterium]|nr:response regulator transcription factor [Lachnospiraceae bacterium]
MYKVLLVDDEMLILDSLEIILSLGGMEIAGKAADGKTALQILEALYETCDIALVDLNMKGMGGIELIKIMKEKYPDIKILVLTTFYDDKYITEALTGGADGYLLKDSGKEVIIAAVNQILGGITVLDQKVMARLTEIMAENVSSKEHIGSSANDEYDANNSNRVPCQKSFGMTARESQICTLMAEGLTNRQIADRLYISEGTVKNYISGIYDKTGIHDRVKLIVELKK